MYYDAASLLDRWLDIRPMALRLAAIAGALASAVLLFAPLWLKYTVANAALTVGGMLLLLVLVRPVVAYSIDSLGLDSVRTRVDSAAGVARGFCIVLAATIAWLALRALATPFITQAQQDASYLINAVGPGMSPLTYVAINLPFILNAMYVIAFCPIAMALLAWAYDVSRQPEITFVRSDDRCPTCGRQR